MLSLLFYFLCLPTMQYTNVPCLSLIFLVAPGSIFTIFELLNKSFTY